MVKQWSTITALLVKHWSNHSHPCCYESFQSPLLRGDCFYELKTNYSNTVDLGNNIHKLNNGTDPSAIKIPNNERNQFPGAFLEGVNEDHLMEAATKKYTGKVRHSPAWTVSLLVQFQLVWQVRPAFNNHSRQRRPDAFISFRFSFARWVHSWRAFQLYWRWKEIFLWFQSSLQWDPKSP